MVEAMSPRPASTLPLATQTGNKMYHNMQDQLLVGRQQRKLMQSWTQKWMGCARRPDRHCNGTTVLSINPSSSQPAKPNQQQQQKEALPSSIHAVTEMSTAPWPEGGFALHCIPSSSSRSGPGRHNRKETQLDL
jgi:hypothetical protein